MKKQKTTTAKLSNNQTSKSLLIINTVRASFNLMPHTVSFHPSKAEQHLQAKKEREIAATLEMIQPLMTIECSKCDNKESVNSDDMIEAAKELHKKGWRKDKCPACMVVEDIYAQLKYYKSSHYYIDSSVTGYGIVSKVTDKLLFVSAFRIKNGLMNTLFRSFRKGKRKPNFKTYTADPSYLGFLFKKVNNTMHYCHIYCHSIIYLVNNNRIKQPSNIKVTVHNPNNPKHTVHKSIKQFDKNRKDIQQQTVKNLDVKRKRKIIEHANNECLDR